MLKIIDGCGTGKTRKIIEYAQQNNAIVVCANPLGMEQKARAYEIYNVQFISYKDFIRIYDPDIHSYVIDEIDNFVEEIIQGPTLIGYTLTKED